MPTRAQRITEAIEATTESTSVDFKERFNPASTRDWCETVKDIVALANSGGGCLVFGIRDNGAHSGWKPDALLKLDPAVVADKIHKYTGRHFASFEIVCATRHNSAVAVLVVDEVRVPLVFNKPGTYAAEKGRQGSAFAQGTVYFRHGAKSEPATSEDLATVMDRRLTEERDHLLTNVRKVFQAPPGHDVVLSADPKTIAPGGTAAIRLTTDPDAPLFRPVSPDQTYPFRQKEVIAEFNDRVADDQRINTHDILCVRKAHGIDASTPEFVEFRKYGSPQYSVQFVDWLIEQVNADPEFFDRARVEYRALTTSAK